MKIVLTSMISIIENSQTWDIPLIDFHTHIGKVAIETTKGASQRINRPQDIIDLYEKLKFELYSRLESDSDKYYITLPAINEFVKPLFPIVKNVFYNELSLKGWIADQIVSFPFNDIFHTKTKPKFVKSNEYVRHSVNKFDFSFRFIPFCRVDATEEQASEEVINSAKLGAKGLKLHPLSQNWIDKIVTPEVKKVLQTAGKLKLPIIFDVPNKGVAKDITEIAMQARSEVDYPINVVLGHTGFDYTSSEIFEYISQEGMVTETSGMRGSDVKLFFKNVRKVPNWHDKIIFGTDSNYFTVLQAADFITFLFSNDFKELVSEDETTLHPLEIASKILGLNALNLIPLNYENRTELSYETNNNDNVDIFQINSTNLVSSLKKLIQKKEIFYNLSLKPLNKGLEYNFHIINDKELHSYAIKSNDNVEGNNIVLEPIPVNEENPIENKITLELYHNFCKNDSNKENIHSNKEKIKPITDLEELI